MYNTLNILTVALQLQVNIHLNVCSRPYTWSHLHNHFYNTYYPLVSILHTNTAQPIESGFRIEFK